MPKKPQNQFDLRLFPVITDVLFFRRFIAQHKDFVGNNLSSCMLCAIFVFPIAVCDSAIDGNFLPFFQVLFANRSQVSPCHNIVPFGGVFLVSVFVGVAFAGGEAKSCQFVVLFEVADFWILTKASIW